MKRSLIFALGVLGLSAWMGSWPLAAAEEDVPLGVEVNGLPIVPVELIAEEDEEVTSAARPAHGIAPSAAGAPETASFSIPESIPWKTKPWKG